MFLLLSIALASAFTDHKNVVASISPSSEVRSLTDTNICDPKDVYKSEVWGPTQDCSICTYYSCTPRPQSQIFCQCCCAKPPSPPQPPASPPPPTLPSGQPGDTSTETTIITSNCADCTNWCKEECSGAGGYVIDDKCAIGESNFVRRCKCCCRENSGPKPPPPGCPTFGCPSETTWTIPGVSPCKYKLVSSLSLPV
ncbi:hypothetical protein MKX01_042186 [Papaver californicum]|nr:hypothetical protein MKX01_042186 [Papaver californicum]